MTNQTRAKDVQGVPLNGGQYAHPLLPEAEVSLGTDQSMEQLIETRDEIAMAYWAAREDDENPDPDLDRLDGLHQQYSLNLAAAHLKENQPDAATLRVTQNDDGENQFDIRELLDKDGNVLLSVDDDGDEWTWEDPGSPTDSVALQELIYPLNLNDYSWADGVATNRSNKHIGKSFDIDLSAVLARPLPPNEKPVSVNDILARREETAEQRHRIEEDRRHFANAGRRDDVALISAHILSEHPTAKTLFIEQDEDDSNHYAFESVTDADGNILLSNRDGSDDSWVWDQPGGEGNNDMYGLLRDVSPHSDSWAEGIAENADVVNGLSRFSINLRDAVSAPPLAHPDAGNPRRRPLTHQEQDDLVEAAFYGLGGLEDSMDGLDDSDLISNREGLLGRLNNTLTFTKDGSR